MTDLDGAALGRYRAAWARLLGVPTFPVHGSVRVERESAVVTVVTLGEGTVLAGPSPAMRLLVDVDPVDLADHDRLLALTAPAGAAALGAADLFAADGTRTILPVDDRVGRAPDDAVVARLESACSAADVAEVGLTETTAAGTAMTHRWVLLQHGEPLAAAGYAVWVGSIAHLGVLTHPAHRGRGLGRALAAVAAQDAVDRDLLPQWRSRTSNASSAALALRLGLMRVGSQTTVLVG